MAFVLNSTTTPAGHQHNPEQVQELSEYTLHLMWMMRQDAIRCFEGLGVRPVKALMLGLIAKNFVTPSMLADVTEMQPSAISTMLSEFEDKGWLKREMDSQDRRRVQLHLTKKGEALLCEMNQRWNSVAAQRLSALSSEELGQLLHIYRRITQPISQCPQPDNRAMAEVNNV